MKTWEDAPPDFERLLGTPGVGAKTLRALALVSELVYGTPASTRDPARFSFAHGGKDGHPFPSTAQPTTGRSTCCIPPYGARRSGIRKRSRL